MDDDDDVRKTHAARKLFMLWKVEFFYKCTCITLQIYVSRVMSVLLGMSARTRNRTIITIWHSWNRQRRRTTPWYTRSLQFTIKIPLYSCVNKIHKLLTSNNMSIINICIYNSFFRIKSNQNQNGMEERKNSKHIIIILISVLLFHIRCCCTTWPKAIHLSFSHVPLFISPNVKTWPILSFLSFSPSLLLRTYHAIFIITTKKNTSETALLLVLINIIDHQKWAEQRVACVVCRNNDYCIMLPDC